MASENKSKVSILTNGIIKENPVLRLVLGTCSCLAVTTAVSSALGMGAAFTFVLVCSNILISLLRNVIPAKVHLPCYIVIIAGFVTIVQMVMHAYMDSLYTALGVFLPLIVVNCIILGRAEMFACKNNVVDSALDGVGMGIGYTLTVVLMATIREVLGSGTWLPGPARQHRPHQHHDSGSRRILLLRRPDGRLCLAGRQAGCAHRAQELLRHRQSEEGGLIRCSSNSLLSSSA
jgi:electron transport complex protein RnfE